MTQTAFVTRIVDSSRAEVLVQRKTACGGSCESCGGACAANSRMYVVANNRAAAAVGDRVKLVSSTGGVLSAAMLVYGLPFALFFVGYAAAALAALPESLCIVISLLAFAAGVLVVVLRGRARKPIAFDIMEIL